MQPIESKDLRPVEELTRAFFRATNPHVTSPSFMKKWADALSSPLRFMRSFPQAWYVDLLELPPAKIPDAYCLCLGDAHPENFGFLTFEEGARYVFNDLDDSGPGWAALDALRYFTTLVLAGYGDELHELTQLYEDLVTRRRQPRDFPEALVPDIGKADAKELGKWIEDGEFRYGDAKRQLMPVDADLARALLEAMNEQAMVSHLEIMSLARRGRDGGGSGGLARYLALARDQGDGEVHLLEFKEATHPATSWMHSLQAMDERLERIQEVVWRDLTPRCYREVQLGRTLYLLRHRTGRANVKVDKLDASARRQVLEVQVSILADQHRESFLGVDASQLDEWLDASVEVMAERFHALYDRLKGEAS